MVEVFCLRLAFGMIASLLVLDPKPIPPRFFRVQFLAALGLLAVASYFFSGIYACVMWSRPWPLSWAVWFDVALGASFGTCILGCIVWHLDNAPWGAMVVRSAALSLGVLLFSVTPYTEVGDFEFARLADNFLSAALLGTVTSAMLLGHSYLISPAMTISPLRRMLVAAWVALALRVGVSVVGLWQWTAEHSLGNLERETLLWLSARWLLGLLAPVVLGWMAWEAARIRSTQSATGILYVVVIVSFLGELLSLLLLQKTGSIL